MGEQEAVQSHDPDLPQRFREFMRTGWADSPLEAPEREAVPDFADRRARLAAAFPGETLIIPAGREVERATGVSYPFRPGSDHVWLGGCQDPEAVLVVRALSDGPAATLYTRPRSGRDTDEFFADRRYGELWIGRRPTLAETATELGVATADLAGLPEVLDGCAPGRTRVLRGLDPAVDAGVRPANPTRDRELAHVLAELRLVKDDWEITQLSAAIEATIRGFEDLARLLPADRPVSERLLEGAFALRARHDGNEVGYGSIVGSGAHATVLHWTRNDGLVRPGELVLMDLGVEARSLYTADLTRTWPVSGTFTPVQREVYDIVVRAQRAGFAAIAPGVRFEEVHLACSRALAEGLHDLGVLPVSVDEAMDPDRIWYRRWTLHGSGHMLGLDVHDCAAARPEAYRKGTLGQGYVLTVEPGLYFQPEDELVPAELRGLGIRVEDDVLVTATGAKVLSAELPREAEAVERWLAEQRQQGPRWPGRS